MRVTRTPRSPLLTNWLLVRLSVSSLGTLRIKRGTDATTLPLVESSYLAMWCSMSLSSPFPPPPLSLPPRSLTSPLCFPLTRWSSHLCWCFLQVLLRLYPARVSRGHLSAQPLRTTGSRTGDSDPIGTLRPTSARLPATCPRRWSRTGDSGPTGTLRPTGAHISAVPDWRRCLRRHGVPLFAGVSYATGSVFPASDTDTVPRPQLPVSRRRCTTHRFFTDTRVMFTLW